MSFLSTFRVAVVVLPLIELLTVAFPLRGTEVEITDYERTLQSERRSIEQIHLKMETDDVRGNGVQVTQSTREIWQDKDKRRCDEIREYLDGNGVTEVAPHRFVSIETPDYFLWWNSRPPSGGGRMCAHFGSNKDVNYKAYQPMLPFDARQLGLSVSDIFGLHNRDTEWNLVIASPNRIAPTTVEKQGDQVNVSFMRSSGLTIQQVYEARGNKCLLRSVSLTQNKDVLTMKCGYPVNLVAGFAFPESIETKYVRGDYITYHDTTKIWLKAINEPIPRSRFSIVTAELPPGTPVIGDAIPPDLLKGFPFHHIEWNGEALVPVKNKAIALPNAGDNVGQN